jgi:hypothetical protein
MNELESEETCLEWQVSSRLASLLNTRKDTLIGQLLGESETKTLSPNRRVNLIIGDPQRKQVTGYQAA